MHLPLFGNVSKYGIPNITAIAGLRLTECEHNSPRSQLFWDFLDSLLKHFNVYAFLTCNRIKVMIKESRYEETFHDTLLNRGGLTGLLPPSPPSPSPWLPRAEPPLQWLACPPWSPQTVETIRRTRANSRRENPAAFFMLAGWAEMGYSTRSMAQQLKIGTRGSELALKQTELVIQALKEATPELECEVVIINTPGDSHRDIPLHEVNKKADVKDKGIFIATLEQALADGQIDCAVHSLKDMPGTLDERFRLSAIMPRESIWDVLVVREGADMEHPVLGTGSVRREQMIRYYWSGNAKAVPIRGNVPTRLRKLVESDELDGIVLARAGLNRLGMEGDLIDFGGHKLHVIDMEKDSFMPALGQGAIAVETRKDDEATHELIAKVNDRDSEVCVRAEKAFLAALQADCSVPVAGYATCNQDFMMFRALYFPQDGPPVRITRRGSAQDPEGLGRAAHEDLLKFLS